MGLWSKGIERSKTGEERIENMFFDKHLIHQIQDFITKMTNGDGHVKTKGDTLKMYVGDEDSTSLKVLIGVPQPKCNAPWIMQTLMMTIQPYYGTSNMSNPLIRIYKQLLKNTALWANTKNPTDDIFFNIDD